MSSPFKCLALLRELRRRHGDKAEDAVVQAAAVGVGGGRATAAVAAVLVGWRPADLRPSAQMRIMNLSQKLFRSLKVT